MAELTTLARPYANAAFDLAKAANRLDAWSGALRVLSEALANSEIQQYIKTPSISTPQKIHFLLELFGPRPSEEIRRFTHVVAENQRLELLPQIAELFEARCAAEQQILEVTVATAVELKAAQVKRFKQSMEKKFASQIELKTEVDPALIGGAFIRAGETVIDLSVRGKIEKLKEALQRA